MKKFKGLLCSVSMAAVLMFSGIAAYAEETEAATAAATEAVTEAAAEAAPEDGISASDREALESYAQASIEMIVAMTDEQIEEQINPSSVLAIVEDSVVSSLESWKGAREELGAYKAAKSHEITVTDDNIIIATTCDFENMEGIVNTTLNREDLSMEGMVFSTGDVSMGQKMQEAALNTVMGLGVVFAVLIFLSFLIAQFKHIAKLEAVLTKKDAAPAAPKAAPAPVAAPVVEEVVDDGELIAVIAAAIAAAEGTSTDGFVVRSIKKHNRKKWQNA